MRGLALSCLCAVLASTAAQAATVTRHDFDGKTALTFNRADCDRDAVRLFLQIDALTEPLYYLRWVDYPRNGTVAGCPTDMLDPLAEAVLPEESQTPTSGRILIQRDVDHTDLMGPGSCPTTDAEAGRRFNGFLCLQLYLNPADLQAVAVDQLDFDVDTTLPATPTVTKIAGGDASIVVTVEPETSGDPIHFLVEARKCDAAADAGTTDAGTGADDASICGASGAFQQATGDGPEIKLDGLENESDYEVRVTAVDDFDNPSTPTALVIARPISGLGALDLYDGEPDPYSFNPASCGTGSAAGVFGLLLLGGLSAKKKRRRRGLFSLLALLFAVAGPARAQVKTEPPPNHGFGRTTLSLSVGSYHPDFDSATTFPVYDCVFDDATMWRAGGDGDTHLFDDFGSLQFTLGLELGQATGYAQPLSAAGGGTCRTPTKTKAQLTLATARAGLTYRFDPLLDWLAIPLVPYARAGVLAAGYAFTKGGEFETGGVDRGVNPMGVRFGYEGAAGVMVALDLLDPLDCFTPWSIRRARANRTLDHAFIFAEGAWQDITGFGQPGFVFSPTDTLFGTGLPMAWRAGLAVELF